MTYLDVEKLSEPSRVRTATIGTHDAVISHVVAPFALAFRRQCAERSDLSQVWQRNFGGFISFRANVLANKTTPVGRNPISNGDFRCLLGRLDLFVPRAVGA
jgi:hypothetical protein